MKSPSELAQLVLEYVIDSPQPVSGIFGLISRYYPELRVDPRTLLETLWKMEDDGLVRGIILDPSGDQAEPVKADRQNILQRYENWLSQIRIDDVLVDEIGLWYGITPVGQSAWRESTQGIEPGRWRLEEFHDNGDVRVTVLAVDRSVAESILAEWVSRNSHLSELEPPVFEDDVKFTLAGGFNVDHGVRLRSRYLDTRAKSRKT